MPTSDGALLFTDVVPEIPTFDRTLLFTDVVPQLRSFADSLLTVFLKFSHELTVY